jgi:hypothetical protein
LCQCLLDSGDHETHNSLTKEYTFTFCTNMKGSVWPCKCLPALIVDAKFGANVKMKWYVMWLIFFNTALR